ncbi:transporter substrate-binding domain-containing protein [Rheinheimera sp. 1928-s]|uniref:substrate-binding periplasmic protein n=1 Tax=Rheinheimera sp. 1928-s TaxID=3033803 RepID=UPI0026369D18|nr:transporter substrate-binding domain-containing protein [Rheinheimera sp. 1928-s]MDF3124161.1 transporter substrate-binding domain-containing protein [Rheinheimera sp. 1928-s]
MKSYLGWLCLWPLFVQAEQAVRLASLDWPPYTGHQLEQQGETTVLLRQVFASMQLELQTEFLPWSRAIRASEKAGGLYSGYFPEYQTYNPKFILSDSLGVSELGFVEATTKPLGQLNVASLAQFQLGVVQDYVNLTLVDQMITRGQLKPQLALSDRQNVLKVALGRLDLAVIDRRVLLYLLEHDTEVKRLATDKVQFNSSFTELKTLHLALRREPAHQQLIEKFNQHLQKVKSGSAAILQASD